MQVSPSLPSFFPSRELSFPFSWFFVMFPSGSCPYYPSNPGHLCFQNSCIQPRKPDLKSM